MKIITYIAPDGDAQSVTWGGYDFVSGVPVEVENPHIIAKAHGNPCFTVDEAEPAAEAAAGEAETGGEKPRRGRPPKVARPAGEAETGA